MAKEGNEITLTFEANENLDINNTTVKFQIDNGDKFDV